MLSTTPAFILSQDQTLMFKFVIADVLDLYQIYCLKVPINDWTFVNSFELLEYSHLNLSRFFTVQLSMFFCVASVWQRLDYSIRYSVVCQQLFSFYFPPLRFKLSSEHSTCYHISSCLSTTFYLPFDLKLFQRTLISYQTHL